jgi:tRNA threonylcarbamoyladenosine biosynthesis protein TsaB
MLILAVDTSGKSLSLAVCEDQNLIAEMTLRQGYNHSVTQMPLLQDLLRHSSITVSEIDLYACTTGPGSFTGVRIGVSSVKAMAYAAGKPALGVSSLRALAYPLRNLEGVLICSVIDARRGRVFAGAWSGGADKFQMKPVIDEKNRMAEDLISILDQYSVSGQQIIIVGDGQEALYQAWLKHDNKNPAGRIVWDNPGLMQISASSVARLAYEQWQAGADNIPQELLPEYLSPSQAERMKNMQVGK